MRNALALVKAVACRSGGIKMLAGGWTFAAGPRKVSG
jgi:hypothetical protein